MNSYRTIINWFRDNDLGGVTLEDVWSVLGEHVSSEDENPERRGLVWTISYENSFPFKVELYADGVDEDLTSCLVVPSHFDIDLLWQHLFCLASMRYGVLFVSEFKPIITNRKTETHIPSGLAQARGELLLVEDVETFMELIGERDKQPKAASP